jgi:hypothetical protein
VSSVTFHPCPGPAGQTQFDGGFIVVGPQCAEIEIRRNGRATKLLRVPFGRRCGAAPAADRILEGDRIGQVTFGEARPTVLRELNALLGRAPSHPYHIIGACRADHGIDWPGLSAYFHHGRFVGYAYLGQHGDEPVLATAKGLLVGDTLRRGRRLYGSGFHVSPEQGGSWSGRTPNGRIDGFTSEITNLKGKVLTIEAGYVGCPAMTP